MKKIIALILTLAMVAVIVPFAVSADDAAQTFKVAANRGDWEITNGNDYTCYSRPGAPNFGLYVLGNALDGEVTLSADLTIGNEYGFMFGITDSNNDGAIAETGDQYYLVDLRPSGLVGLERNDKKWDGDKGDGGWDDTSEVDVANPGETVTLTATYTRTADSVTIVVSVDGKEVINYTDNDPFTGVAYGLASKTGEPLKNVSAPDLPGSTMSQALIANVIANNPHIAYKAGTAKTTGTIGAARATGNIDSELENLFDYDADKVMVQNDPNEMTRFCVQYTDGKSQSITWETEEAEVASYFIFYTGPNCTNINRSATTFKFYGSTDGENWTEIANVGRLHLKRAQTVYGIHLDNDTAYNYYRFDFTFDQDELESYGIHLYTDPSLNNSDDGGTTTPPSSEEGGKTPPKTGDSAILVWAVATVALLGTGITVAAKKRALVK